MLEPLSVIWCALLFVASIVCCFGMVALKKWRKAPPPPEHTDWLSLVVYVTAQVTSAVVGTSSSKMFAKTDGAFLYTLIALSLIFAGVNVVSLILAATAVDQGVFVPMQTCATLVTNMITGLIVWQDWKVIEYPSVYAIVHLIMLLGIWLLAPEDQLAQYKGVTQFQPDLVLGAAHGHNPLVEDVDSARNDSIRKPSGTGGIHPRISIANASTSVHPRGSILATLSQDDEWKRSRRRHHTRTPRPPGTPPLPPLRPLSLEAGLSPPPHHTSPQPHPLRPKGVPVWRQRAERPSPTQSLV